MPKRNCRFCKKTFNRPQELKRHLLNIHKMTALFPHIREHGGTRKMKTCAVCKKTFTRVAGLKKHTQTQHQDRVFCDFCMTSFTRKDNLRQHIVGNHMFKCATCSEPFMSETALTHHMETCKYGGGLSQLQEDKQRAEDTMCEEKTAFDKIIKIYKFPDAQKVKNIDAFLQEMKGNVERKLISDLNTYRGIKWNLALQVRFVLTQAGEQQFMNPPPWLCSRTTVLLSRSDFAVDYKQACEHLIKSVETFQSRGSGWVVDGLEAFRLKVVEYKPLLGSSYIELPIELKLKKAILNIKNFDQKCFVWSVLAYLHPVARTDNANRVNKYAEYEKELNMSGIQYPITINQVERFEKQNNISVNIFGYEKKEIFPLHISKHVTEKNVNLLLISNDVKTHYCLIRSLNRLLSSLSNHKEKAFYCHRCLHRFSTKCRLEEHKTLCSKHQAQKISFPTEGNNTMQFKNHHYTLPVPFRIYADFESFNEKVDDSGDGNTKKLTSHEPSGFAFVIVDINGELYKEPVIYRGVDVVATFLTSLLNIETELLRVMEKVTPMVLTEEDKMKFQNTVHCNVCQQRLGDDRVRDHCHITGKYRQALHSTCNLNLKMCSHIPVIFHNLRKYDAHLIMSGVGRIKDRKISCIAKTMEEYISFSIGHLRFLDSYQLIPASLDALIQNLLDAGKENFKITTSHFPKEKAHLLLRKGVFPYEYLTDESKFREEHLPPITAFYSSLTQEGITEDQYDFAQRVWREFQIKNLGEYHDLYVLSDVLLLSDVFEAFRMLCFENDGIDPCHVYTAPGLALQSCLKMTNIELELLTDPDMYLFCEEGIRGGISMISHRYSKANNKYLEGSDPKQPSKYIIYWDCTNLYGHAMRRHLPVGGFRWLTLEEMTNFNVNQVGDEDEDGFILCVDLDYPTELHDLHNDYPLAAEKQIITPNMISPYCKNLAEELGISTNSTIPKLVPNLNKKSQYIIHYVNLKQCLAMGLKLTKIHKILTFKQKPWMRPFVDYNTEKRKTARNDFEKDFYKLKINSMFGKTMENVRKRMQLELVTTKKRTQKLVASPAFKDFKIFQNELVAIQSIKPNLVLDKPIYVGFSILELSKETMYNFHYGFVKAKYGDKAKLLLTDTDSLVYEIETDDLYKDLELHGDLFDNSVYDKVHPLHNDTNKKKVGTFKDEHANSKIVECIALRPKLYSILEEGGKEKKVGKGIVRATLQRSITHDDYKKTLEQKIIKSADMYSIRNFDHNIFTIKQGKLSLCPYDDKRYILEDGITTLAHGHKRANSEGGPESKRSKLY